MREKNFQRGGGQNAIIILLTPKNNIEQVFFSMGGGVQCLHPLPKHSSLLTTKKFYCVLQICLCINIKTNQSKLEIVKENI